MRLLIPALLFPTLLTAQVNVRSYYDTFSAIGPLLDHVAALPNGDVLYYDQGFGGLARLDAQGAVVWYQRMDISEVPSLPYQVAHATYQSTGDIVLALVQRDANGNYHPGLMRLNADGALLSASMDLGTNIGLADWLQVAVLANDEIRMSIRGTGDGGTIHRFSAAGVYQGSKAFSGNGHVPISLLRKGDVLVGANVGRLQAYTPNGFPDWSLTPGFTTVGGTGYGAVIVDVVPIPIGYAFSFLRLGGPELMTPGIGLVSDNGIFQGGIVFQVDELQGVNTLFSYPQLCTTLSGLAMVANNGSSTDPTGYLFTCNYDLSNAHAMKVSIGEESYPTDIVATATFGTVMCGSVQQPGAGERMVAHSAFAADMSSCFPLAPFSIAAFPMAFTAPVTFSGTDLVSTFTEVVPVLTPATFSSNLLCGADAIAESGSSAHFGVYPVPAHNSLRVEWPHTEALNIRVLDASGRDVLSAPQLAASAALEVADLRSGVYFLHVQGITTGTARVLRMVVE